MKLQPQSRCPRCHADLTPTTRSVRWSRVALYAGHTKADCIRYLAGAVATLREMMR